MLEVAAVPEATKQSILHAFDLLTDLMIDLVLPIAGVMITSGACAAELRSYHIAGGIPAE